VLTRPEGGEHVLENHMKLVVIGIKNFSMDIYEYFITLTHISFYDGKQKMSLVACTQSVVS
jgi:hypothetical protein